MIRLAVLSDIERLPVEQFLRETQESGGALNTPGNIETFMQWARRAIGGPFIVAEEDGVIVGFTFCTASTDPTDTGFKDLLGFGTWVDPDRRHAGIGRAMRAALHEAAAKGGFDRILEMAPLKNASTQKSIERYGYTPIYTTYEWRL